MIIRAAGPDDADALGMVGFAAWAQSAFGIDDDGRADRTKLLGEFSLYYSENPDGILVAEDRDGTLMGWGAHEEGYVVSDLWVGPHAQGKGVGAALLAALEEVIALNSFNHVELETYAGNAGAVRFYARQGYEPIWRGMKFSASLNYELDKIRFRKLLSEAE